jgi:hypothetical protein
VTVVRSMVLRRLTAEEAAQGNAATRLGATVQDVTVGQDTAKELETSASKGLQG